MPFKIRGVGVPLSEYATLGHVPLKTIVWSGNVGYIRWFFAYCV